MADSVEHPFMGSHDFLSKQKSPATDEKPQQETDRSRRPSPERETGYARDGNHDPRSGDDEEDDGDDSDSTATHASDFDWSDEDEETKLAEARANDLKRATRFRRVWLLLGRLSTEVRLLLVGVIGCGIIITPYVVFLTHFKSSSAYKQVATWSIWLAITWAAGVVTSFVVSILPRLIIRVIFAVWGKPPETLKTYIELILAVSGWMNLALDISWLWVALGGVRGFIDPPGSYWTWVNRVCSALFSAGIVILAEKALLQFIAIHFHQKALADRLAENRLALRALDKLSVAPAVTRKQASKKQAKKFGGSSRNSSFDALSRANSTTLSAIGSNPALSQLKAESENMSPTTSNSRPSSPAAIEKTTTAKSHHHHHHPHVHVLDGHRDRHEEHARRRRKRQKFTVGVLEQLGEAIGQVALKDSKFNRAGEIGSLQSARQLARQLFSNLASLHPVRHFLLVEDFFPYFKTEQEARTAFMLFDKDDNGDISKKEMREAVQRIYRERKTLTASLKDASSAVAKLDGVLLGVAFLAIFFICLLIFNRGSTIESLVPLATLVLGFSFIFGHSAQLLFESLIFIFSTHPYDVGDLVIIDDQPLFVKEFGLFSTVFTRVDGPHIIAPNALLANSKLLHNVRRSGTMWETTNLQIAYDTSLQTIESLKTRLRGFMADNQREWGTPGCEIWIDHMDYQNDIQLIVAIEHRANWQDWGARWGRRNKFMKHMKSVLEDLNVGYRQPLQPVSFHPRSLAPPSSMFPNESVSSPRGARGSFGQDPSSPLMGGPAARVSGRSPSLGTAPPGPSVNAGRYF